MTTDREELFGLFEALCDGVITPAEHGRLQQRLAADAAARQFYFDYLDLRLHLRQWQRTCAGEGLPDIEADAVPSAPLAIHAPPLDVPVSAIYSPIGSFAFSYLVAALIVGLGLMVGWVYHVPTPHADRGNAAKVVNQRPAARELPPPPEIVVVGRVTGMIDCRWADAKTVTALAAPVALGQKYDLASGLLKISYRSGAQVILQGPCTYQVESPTAGLLSFGRLTAKVKGRGERGEGRGERGEGREEKQRGVAGDQLAVHRQRSAFSNQHSADSTQQSPSPPSSLPSPLFTVHTPTATITDLGTEFGVEVEKSGISRADVFEGMVELRAICGNAQPISLRANESARVDFGRNGVVAVVRQKGRGSTLLREMPKSAPIVLFSTGVGLTEGDADPHWQLISRSDDPTFKPRPARVRVAGNAALENDPARSQWISLVGGDVDLPEDVTYIFRTTFDLTGMLPSTAVLRGKFIADDRVTEIRLNGRRLAVPLQCDGEPFIYWTKFHAETGFVHGINVLEVDVLNAGPFTPPSQRRFMKSRMSCRVELEGEACRDPGLGGGEPSGKPPPAATSSKTRADDNS